MLWMRTPGIHFLFCFVHADLKEKCYLYNPKEDKFLGQTEVVIKGSGNGITKVFDGEVLVAGYELEGETVDSIPMQKEDSIWNMQYACVTGSIKENSEGVESCIHPDGKKCFVEHSKSNTVMTDDQNLDAGNYLAVEILWELYQQKTTVPRFLLVRILETLLGGIMVIFPKVLWVFRYGWLFKNAEVNPPVLWGIRIIGIVGILWMYLF